MHNAGPVVYNVDPVYIMQGLCCIALPSIAGSMLPGIGQSPRSWEHAPRNGLCRGFPGSMLPGTGHGQTLGAAGVMVVSWTQGTVLCTTGPALCTQGQHYYIRQGLHYALQDLLYCIPGAALCTTGAHHTPQRLHYTRQGLHWTPRGPHCTQPRSCYTLQGLYY
jgi:hypothetical protein